MCSTENTQHTTNLWNKHHNQNLWRFQIKTQFAFGRSCIRLVIYLINSLNNNHLWYFNWFQYTASTVNTFNSNENSVKKFGSSICAENKNQFRIRNQHLHQKHKFQSRQILSLADKIVESVIWSHGHFFPLQFVHLSFENLWEEPNSQCVFYERKWCKFIVVYNIRPFAFCIPHI